MAKVRVTQTWLEVVADHTGAELNVTQALLEVFGQASDEALRVSQAALEVLGTVPAPLRVSQALVEVLGVTVGPTPPTVTVSSITETSALLTGSAFDQGGGSSAVHLSSRWRVYTANTGVEVYDSGITSTDLTSHTPPDGSFPAGTDLVARVMYQNQDLQWSLSPGIPSAVFQTLGDSSSGGLAIEFWSGDDDGPGGLISTHYTERTTDTAYGDWIMDENIPVPANTRWILVWVWAFGGSSQETRIKQVQLDKGILSGGYHPAGFRPELHTVSDIPASGFDEGAISGSSFEIDWLKGDVAAVELTLSSTMSWANIEPYRDYYLIVKQDATGSRLLTWPTEAKFAGGTPPTLTTTAGAKDVFKLVAESASIVHVHTLALDSK